MAVTYAQAQRAREGLIEVMATKGPLKDDMLTVVSVHRLAGTGEPFAILSNGYEADARWLDEIEPTKNLIEICEKEGIE